MLRPDAEEQGCCETASSRISCQDDRPGIHAAVDHRPIGSLRIIDGSWVPVPRGQAILGCNRSCSRYVHELGDELPVRAGVPEHVPAAMEIQQRDGRLRSSTSSEPICPDPPDSDAPHGDGTPEAPRYRETCVEAEPQEKPVVGVSGSSGDDCPQERNRPLRRPLPRRHCRAEKNSADCRGDGRNPSREAHDQQSKEGLHVSQSRRGHAMVSAVVFGSETHARQRCAV